MEEFSWTYKPMPDHYDHLHRHLKASSKPWTYYFFYFNLNPNPCLYFSECINKIELAVNMGDTYYFFNQKGSYYDDILYMWKNMISIKQG